MNAVNADKFLAMNSGIVNSLHFCICVHPRLSAANAFAF